jgi:hypothetical protein
MARKAKDLRPPAPPWKPIGKDEPAQGCFSVYLSDDLSRLPVRAVTLANNNKSDPNIETRTYGLFSTCSRAMRSSAVNRGLRYVFFMTRWRGERVITGYYRLAWFAPGALQGSPTDYCLAADDVRFLWPPVRLRDLSPALRREASKRFRLFKLLKPDAAFRLFKFMSGKPDSTDMYVREIDRLERFNLYRTGFRYVAWKQSEKFDWTLADRYLRTKQIGKRVASVNSSPTDIWKCSDCNKKVLNKALLKRCPNCGAIASLQPSK